MSRDDQERILWALVGLTLWVALGSALGWALSVVWERIGERLGHD